LGKFLEGCAEQLTLRARHLAWLHAAPKNADPDSKAIPVSRIASLTDREKQGEDQPLLDLPPVDAAEHLIDYLFNDPGPSVGGEVLTHQEIEAFQRNTGTVLTSWEATTLRRLSGAYLSELNAATDPQRPPPHIASVESHRAMVASKITTIFDRLDKQAVKQGPLPRPKRLRT